MVAVSGDEHEYPPYEKSYHFPSCEGPDPDHPEIKPTPYGLCDLTWYIPFEPSPRVEVYTGGPVSICRSPTTNEIGLPRADRFNYIYRPKKYPELSAGRHRNWKVTCKRNIKTRHKTNPNANKLVPGRSHTERFRGGCHGICEQSHTIRWCPLSLTRTSGCTWSVSVSVSEQSRSSTWLAFGGVVHRRHVLVSISTSDSIGRLLKVIFRFSFCTK